MKKQTQRNIAFLSDLAGTNRTFCMLGELSARHQRVIIGSLLKHFDGSVLGVNNYLFKSFAPDCLSQQKSFALPPPHLCCRLLTSLPLPSLPPSLLPCPQRRRVACGAEQRLIQSIVSQPILPLCCQPRGRMRNVLLSAFRFLGSSCS